MKSLLFFSNPFGYGPTATMVAVLRPFLDLANINIYVIAHGLCSEIINRHPNVTVIDIDQRNIDEIKNLITKCENPYIISSLNRFAVLAAKEMGVPSCFIDTLTYLWTEIPNDYLQADMYYASDFPTVSEKTSNYTNAFVTPLIMDNIKKNVAPSNRKGILLSLGGLKSPLSDDVPTDYLDIIVAGLNAVDTPVTVACCRDAADYIRDNVTQIHSVVGSITKNEFSDALAHAKLCISSPGLNTAIESINYKTPISYLMPTNLSQWVNYNFFAQFNASGTDIKWEDLTGKELNIAHLTEYDAIIAINTLAKQIRQNPVQLDKFVSMFQKCISKIPDTLQQQELLTRFGTTGAEFIFNDICEKWGIKKCWNTNHIC